MKTLPFSFPAAVAAILLFLIRNIAAGAEEGAAGPVQNDGAGKRAWDLLGGLYQKEERESSPELERAVDEALEAVSGDDKTKATEAAQLILSLFRQAEADERNGRAEWKRSMAWGGGANSQAREFRKSLAGRAGKSATGDAAVPVAEWLLREERLPAGQGAAVQILERTSGAVSDAALLQILEKGVHFAPALVMALEQAGKRPLKDRPEFVSKWSTDARKSVREAAAGALKELGLPAPAEFKPEDAFSEPVQKLLTDIYALMPDPPAAEAAFGRFEITDTYQEGKPSASFLSGWLRGEKDGVMRMTTWHGVATDLEPGGKYQRTVKFEKLEPADVVREIRSLRESEDKEASNKLMEELSARGGLTGQFEPRQLSAPEGFLAAWLFKKGDRANTAALIFPALDALDDDRWPLGVLSDLAGKTYHQEMLDAFSHQRNYTEALRLAKHLSQPLFADYQYHERAKELAAQLPKRLDDFKTLILPTPEEWKTTTAALPREKQVEYLVSRLRLLNCFQLGQPGDVDYRDEQYREPGHRWSGEKPAAMEVINPYNELRRLRLLPADLLVLAPYLKDDNYLPTYSYWRDFHPSRTLEWPPWIDPYGMRV
jgi:hypothetical protein